LAWELQGSPISVISTDELLGTVRDIVRTGCVPGPQRLFMILADLAVDQGFGHHLKEWGTKLDRIQAQTL
jgi:hypothetical protein